MYVHVSKCTDKPQLMSICSVTIQSAMALNKEACDLYSKLWLLCYSITMTICSKVKCLVARLHLQLQGCFNCSTHLFSLHLCPCAPLMPCALPPANFCHLFGPVAYKTCLIWLLGWGLVVGKKKRKKKRPRQSLCKELLGEVYFVYQKESSSICSVGLNSSFQK